MSLYHLGIAHFPTLHRQYSSPSPTASRFARSVREEASPDPDVTQDNKDVLIERLNDLVSRLSGARSLEDGVVSAIHKEVDRIEVLMRGERDLTPVENTPKSRAEDKVSWGPASPSQNVGMHFPSQWPKSPRTPQKAPKKAEISTSKAMEIATAADALVAQLTHAISELQDRKEESLHIHDLLVVRCEKAVERIIFLENRIAELEDDFEANESELRYLKLQLRALEVQCLRYIPPNEDKELTESIQNWRVDWEDIDRQTKARRKKCHVPRPGLGHDDSWSTDLSSTM